VSGVNGRINFDVDRLQVDQLQGQFSQGLVSVTGTLPIFAGARPFVATEEGGAEALSVLLQGVKLQYQTANQQELYDGRVDGNVTITGAALAPRIGGTISLSQGRVSIPDGTQPITTPATPLGDTDPTENTAFTPPELDNLTIVLGDRLVVTRDPVLNFVVGGDLIVNGTADNLQLFGDVELLAGQVNLFTTRFSLARNYNNVARFSPKNGLTPFVDVRLRTSVLETTRSVQFEAAAPFASSEIEDQPISNFGSLRTVQIEASVRGLADEALDNLSLTSDPQRSQGEIIALLGGGFVNTLGQGNEVLAIANLAGSAFLTSIQDLIGNALGASRFSLFPTSISSSEDRTSSFGIAAELGYDLTPDLSVSVLQILTDENVPPQLNLGYRINDEFRLLGSTNFSNENRVLLEYEIRF
jgi:translocation and assembly module TamB